MPEPLTLERLAVMEASSVGTELAYTVHRLAESLRAAWQERDRLMEHLKEIAEAETIDYARMVARQALEALP